MPIPSSESLLPLWEKPLYFTLYPLSKFDDKLLIFERLESRSPAIIFLWKNDEKHSVEYVSENITRLGFTVEEFTDGKIRYIVSA